MKDSEMPLPSKGPKSYTPLSMKEIFAKNTITREEYIAMVTAEQGEVKREIPPHVLALAKADPAPLPVSAEHWLGMKTGSRPWLVIKGSNARGVEILAARILIDKRLNYYYTGVLGRVQDLIGLCESAPLYGPDNRRSIIESWASKPLLAITGFGLSLEPRSAPILADLLEKRVDYMRTTIIAETVPGSEWLGHLRANCSGSEAADRIQAAIIDGLAISS